MPTMHFHSRTLLLIARDTAIRARAEAARPAAFTSDALPAIVMSAASTEAFINEFVEYAAGAYSSIRPDERPPTLTAFIHVLQDLEESRVPVTTRYFIGSQVLDGKGFNTGAAPYQDFRQLIDMRNAIMRIKVAIEGERHSGQRVADALGQRGLAIAKADTGLGSFSWFDRIQAPGVAAWAHDSALEIICAFLDLVPVRQHYDPLESYRRSFREHPPIP
jgi:hypothetical protein